MIEENTLKQDLLEGNKYFKWYWSICNRAKDRILSPDTYVEKHHIYPKSIYGQNKDLVKLTAKEHYIVHLLLWQGLKFKYGKCDIYTRKMAGAFAMMNVKSPYNINRYDCKKYDFLKIAYSQIHKNAWNKGLTGIFSDETLEKMSNAAKNRGLDFYKKLHDKNRGKKHSTEHKNKIGISNKGKHFVKMSDQSKINSSISAKKRLKNPTDHPMYGRCAYDIWIQKYGKEYADKRKNEAIEKIKQNHKPKKPYIKYKIQKPDGNIIEIIGRQNVKDILNCSHAFFDRKTYKGYKLLEIIR